MIPGSAIDFTVRLDYTLRPNLTLQFYGAPFASAGAYDEFKRITEPRAGRYEDRFHVFAADEIHYDPATATYAVDENRDGTIDYRFRRPDFNVRDFNANMVVRWEFEPGSVLYAVWSQARADSDPTRSFGLRNDMRGLFDVHTKFKAVGRWADGVALVQETGNPAGVNQLAQLTATYSTTIGTRLSVQAA